MNQPSAKYKEKTAVKIKEPGKYVVVIYNDDFTPMDLVVQILTDIFKHPADVAQTLMMKIHKDESAGVGLYTYEIAEQKAIDATIIARTAGYPLMIKLEISK